MRACPFCAESIQEAAIVCKHCRRDLPQAATATAAASANQTFTPHSDRSSGTQIGSRATAEEKALPKALHGRSQASQVALLLLLVGVLWFAVEGREQGVGNGGLARIFTPPRVIVLAADQDIDVSAGSIQRWQWNVEPGQPTCRLTGHVQVTQGGNRDVRVFVMTADDYANMANGHEAEVSFQTDKTTAVNLDVVTTTPGPKVLAISNTFSVLTGKHVELRDVRATCQ